MLRALLLPLIPAGLTGLACVQVPGAALAALLAITLGIAVLDRVLPRTATETPPEAAAAILCIVHFAVLFATIATIATPGNLLRDVVLFLAAGLWIGQVSNSAAHELIHSPSPALRRLGKWVYVSILFGHHASAHPLVHHRYVATDRDPNSARVGETLYAFLPRAWIGSCVAGFIAEGARLEAEGGSRLSLNNPYWGYVAGVALVLAISAILAGPKGVVLHVLLALHATVQLLATDYVQHYGLRRKWLGDRFEPVGPAHSWNARHAASSRLMQLAPEHSAHHAKLPSGQARVPMLPSSLPVMVTLAFFPVLFRRSMSPKLEVWGSRADTHPDIHEAPA